MESRTWRRLGLARGLSAQRLVTLAFLVLVPVLPAHAQAGKGHLVFRLTDPSETVSWRSLPPGRYEVWLRSRANAADPGRPIALGTHEVRAGSTARVVASVPAAIQGKHPDLRFRLPPRSRPNGLTVWRWHNGTLEQAHATAADDSADLLVRGGCSRDGILLIAGDSSISLPYVFPPAACRSTEAPHTVQTRLLPAGEIGGTVVAPFGFVLPKTAALRLDRCATETWQSSEPLGVYPATLGPDGTWKALVPAGCANLSLQVTGFSPLGWEGLTIVHAAARQLGARRLEPGGSLLARVVSDDGRGVEGAHVAVLEESARRAAVKGILEGGAVASVTSGLTDEQGWVRFDSLPTGTLGLYAVDDRRWFAMSRPFQLVPSHDLVLPDLELAAPGSLVLRGVGADGRAPDAGRVVVTGLVDVADCGWELGFTATLNADTGWTAEIPSAVAGAWRLVPRVSGDGGDHHTAELAPVDVQIGSGERREVEIELAGLVFEGLVTLAGRPIAAELRIRSPDRATHTARSTSEDDGRFSVLLPDAGRFDVLVLGQGVSTTVGGVEFLATEERVRIELPLGAIAGQVVDEKGLPVAGATISAVRGTGLEDPEDDEPRLEAQATSDEAGNFRLAGLAPGKWGLGAWSSEGRSTELHLEVPSEGEVAGVRLVLTAGTTLRGRVLVGGSPAAYVRGSAWPARPLDLPGGAFSFVTGADGRFEVDLGAFGEGLVDLMITDPRLPAAAFLAAVPGEIDLDLDVAGGRVVLGGIGESQQGPGLHRLLLVNQSGAHLPLSEVPGLHLSSVAVEGLPTATIPSLSPGVWSLVAVTTLEQATAVINGRGTSLPALTVFEVRPGLTTEVDLVPASGSR